MSETNRNLLYVMDPMCSWCWGFSPVIDQIVSQYRDRMAFKLLVGGLRPGNTERFDHHKRNDILGHWHAVHGRTRQPFNFSFQMGPDFVYNTEPASRAIVAVRRLAPLQVFPYCKRVQEAFYVHNANVTQHAVLAGLASDHGIERSQFLDVFRSADLIKEVWGEFDYSRQLGVSGFPTLLAQHEGETTMLSHGYQPFEQLSPTIEKWLNSVSSALRN